MIRYGDLRRRRIRLTPLGIELGCQPSPYFCTPRGAVIYGWSGADGIHFCSIKAFGEMVFAVNPTNLPGDYVHPLAKNFEDFLRLILACGGTAAIEQIHLWDQRQFHAFLQENPPSPQARALILQLQEKLSLEPMEQPFSYVKTLQASFNYKTIPYKKDYYEWAPKEPLKPLLQDWKVYWDHGFSLKRRDRSHPGRMILLGKQVQWCGKTIHIPAAYSCAAGLIMDFCIEAPLEQVQAFVKKWAPLELQPSGITQEQQEQSELENPLGLDFSAYVTLGGQILQENRGYGLTWLPPSCLPEEHTNDPEAERVLKHYGLDTERGWAIWRKAFPWPGGRRMEIHSMRLTLSQRPRPVPGPHFTVRAPGNRIHFIHPHTGKAHVLTVQEYERQTASFRQMPQDSEYPSHYTAMSFTVDPELDTRAFSVRDCAQGDSPRRRNTDPTEPQASDAVMIAIIGGACGPVAVAFSGKHAKLHAAASSLHFKPVDQVEWQMIFQEKVCEDITVEMIP